MTPEQLKRIAEWAGKAPLDIPANEDGSIWIAAEGKRHPVIYDPLHNDSQAFELLRKLNSNYASKSMALVLTEIDGIQHINEFEGQTLNEAICNAVWEVIENE